MFVKVCRLESSHGNIEVGLDNRDLVTLIHAEVERLNVIVMRDQPVDPCLHQNVRYERSQVICCYLLVLVERV